jgi:hypothetical protein
MLVILLVLLILIYFRFSVLEILGIRNYPIFLFPSMTKLKSYWQIIKKEYKAQKPLLINNNLLVEVNNAPYTCSLIKKTGLNVKEAGYRIIKANSRPEFQDRAEFAYYLGLFVSDNCFITGTGNIYEGESVVVRVNEGYFIRNEGTEDVLFFFITFNLL